MLPNITRTMIQKSFAAFAANDKNLTINIAESDLREGYLPAYLPRMCDQYGIEPKRVTLEILENISTEGGTDVFRQLCDLRHQGFHLALDDFGSDKSNFQRLQELSVDFIKIDGAFIKDLDTNPNSAKIVRTIKQLADSMGAQVIAEFVATEAIHRKVIELGIEFSQGYFLGKPASELQD